MTELLVTTEEFAEYREVEHDPTDLKALRALEDASDLFRGLAAQTISLVAVDEVELAGNWTHRLWLPERPVLLVSGVTIDDVAVADDAVRTSRRGLMTLRHGGYWGGSEATVRLTYSHGYDPIPGDVRAAVLAMASRSVDSTGRLVSRTIGSYSETFSGADASEEAAGLTSHESRIIRRYRPPDNE